MLIATSTILAILAITRQTMQTISIARGIELSFCTGCQEVQAATMHETAWLPAAGLGQDHSPLQNTHVAVLATFTCRGPCQVNL